MMFHGNNCNIISFFSYVKNKLEILHIFIKTIARQKIRAASAGDFIFVTFGLIEFGSLESPPSNLLKATRKPGYWSYQRFASKGLVMVREGISTPNTPYLR
jgi:hypothetical protein